MAAEITSPRLNWVRVSGSSVGELSWFAPQRVSDLPDLNGALKATFTLVLAISLKKGGVGNLLAPGFCLSIIGTFKVH